LGLGWKVEKYISDLLEGNKNDYLAVSNCRIKLRRCLIGAGWFAGDRRFALNGDINVRNIQ
jgi:hypothetical protein